MSIKENDFRIFKEILQRFKYLNKKIINFKYKIKRLYTKPLT